FLFTGEWGSILFWMEIAISVIIPFIIFAIPGNRRRINVLYIAALIGVVGIVFNRLNVGGLTHLNNLTQIGDFYFPSWTELAVSAAIVSGAMLVFFWFIENFRVWDEPPRNPDEDPHAKPELKGGVYLGPPKTANRTRFSFMFVLAFAIGFAVISGDEITSAGIEDETTRKARGGDTLFIDGNRDDYGVVFKHEFHNMALGRSCVSCHHMNKPEDKNTGCYECHANMYSSFNVFRHDWHSSEEGAGLNCFSCHEQGEYKSGANAKDCDACHDDLIPDGAPIDIKGYEADPYVDAMHIMCIGCHEQKQNENPILMESKRDLTLCSTCHPPGSEKMAEKRLFEVPENKRWVVVPGNIRKK
ncbi:MAG: cytochrome c3 family protein, partial [Bacteroidota bacterium]